MVVEENQDAEKIMSNSPKTDDKLYNESCEIITALGGLENIETVSACATRLRVSLKNNSLVNDDVFKMLGAPGVLKVAGGVQAIFGGKADLYSQEINDIIAHPDMQPVNSPQVDKVSNPQSNSVHKSEKIIFKAPVKGTFEDISQVNDEVFSQKMMGEGFAVKPENGKIYSPVNATVISLSLIHI